MDFNIKTYIEKLKKRTEQLQPQTEKEIQDILTSLGFTIDRSQISYNSGIVSLKNLSPLVKTSIKIKKVVIQKKAQEKNITIRDII